MKGHKDKVMCLKCALYGLKQASLAWWCKLEAFMKTQGFHRASSDTGVFIYKHCDGRIFIALVYVDDRIFLRYDRSPVDEKKVLVWSTGNAEIPAM